LTGMLPFIWRTSGSEEPTPAPEPELTVIG
jgi:hypothetical protein